MLARTVLAVRDSELSILTAPEGAVQCVLGRSFSVSSTCFNPHRPEGAVQWFWRLFCEREIVSLSILTAPEGAVQFERRHENEMFDWLFQSSPPPKERCNSRSFKLL